MWITPAYAQSVGGGSDIFTSILPLVLIFAVFYFLLIRPQQRKMKAHREMLGMVKRGDRVLTGGGIIGTVTRVKDDEELTVEIAEGVKVSVARGTISDVFRKADGSTPAAGSGPTVVTGNDNRRSGGLLGNLLGGGRK